MTEVLSIAASNFLLGFYQALDEGRFDDVAASFAECGEWHRQDKTLVGPAEVKAAFDGRSPTLRVRHVVSNLIIDQQQDGARFNLYITLYSGQGETGSVPAITGPSMVLESGGKLVRKGESWKVQSKKTNRLFIVDPSGV